MKKFLIAAIAFAGLASPVAALDYEPEEGLSTQINLGMSLSNLVGRLNNPPFAGDYKCKIGATAGVKAELMLPNAKGTYINAGLDWTMKGARKTVSKFAFSGYGDFDYTNDITTHYLQIPVHLGYRYNFSDDLGVYADVGPYFAVGVTGKNKKEVGADGSWPQEQHFETSEQIFKDKPEMLNFQRWDAGVGFRVGAEYDNHYSLNLAFDWGLTDMYRESYRNHQASTPAAPKLDKLKNFSFLLSLGYRF